MLKHLALWLKNNGHFKSAQQVDALGDWAEPWHEEVVQEYGHEVIPEEEDTVEQKEDKFVQKIEKMPWRPGRVTSGSQREEINAILSKEDFKTLSLQGKDPIVGQGAFGVVIDGIWNGNPCVAKVILGSVGEVDIWKEIIQAKSKMSAEMQNHIPTIYYVNSSTLEHEDIPGSDPLVSTYGNFPVDRSIDYDIVIMEKLYPMPRDMDDLIRGYGTTESKARTIKDEEFLWEVSKLLTNGLKEKAEEPYQREVLKSGLVIDEQDIFKIILNNIKSNSLKDEAVEYSTTNTKNLIMEYLMSINPELDEMNSNRIRDYVTNTLEHHIDPLGFPTDWTEMFDENYEPREETRSILWENTPETSGFYKAISTMLRDFGIEWNDLHPNNMMVDKDGNLKIIDVGLYKTPKNK